MTQQRHLILKLIILGVVGFIAFVIDSWAKENTSIFLPLMKGIFLLLLMGANIKMMFQGHLKAGPETTAQPRAIEMPGYQTILAVYLMALAILAVFSAIKGSINNYINSPFFIWLIFMPLLVIAFIFEFRTYTK